MADISVRTLVLGLALSLLSCHFVDCKGTLQISYASGRTPHAHHCDAREKNGNYSWFDHPIVVFHVSSCACCSIYSTQFRIPYLGTTSHFRPFYDIFITVNSSIPW